MLAVVVVEAVCLALLTLLVAGLLRSHAEILRALHRLGVELDPARPVTKLQVSARPGPTAARAAAPVAGLDLAGDQVLIGTGRGQQTLLLFLSTACQTCQPFWAALRAGAAGLAPSASAVAVVRDPDVEDVATVAELAGNATVVLSTSAWRDYQVPGSPYAVWVDGDRGIGGEGSAASWEQVVGLLDQARRDARREAAAPPWAVGGRDDAERIDAELRTAGIGAEDPRLYPGRS